MIISYISTSKELEPKTRKNKGFGIELYREFTKIRSLTFDDESEEEEEACLLNMSISMCILTLET